jgi:hypothetical protein
MSTVSIVESNGLSSRWRAFFLLVFAMLQVLVMRRLVEDISTGKWTFAWISAPLPGVIVTGLHGLATRSKPSRPILCWVFDLLVTILGVHIFKLLHRSPTNDAFLTIFNDALWIGLCIFGIWRHPFETTVPTSIRSTGPVLRN